MPRLHTALVAAALAAAPAAAGAQNAPTPPASLSPIMRAAAGAARVENAALRSSLAERLYACPQSPTRAQRGSVPDSWLLTGGNAAADVLVRGDAIFAAHRDAIVEARREVLLQTYVWETSDATRRIGDALVELSRRVAARGGPAVQVYVLVERNLITGLGAAEQARVDLGALGLDPRRVELHVDTYRHMALGSEHAKGLVVNGEIAILTGANPQLFHSFDDRAWYDLGFLLFGDVARALRHDFIDAWACGTDAAPPDPARAVATGEASAAMARPRIGGVAAAVAMRRGAEFPNNQLDNPQGQALLAAFAAAERTIDVQTPNLNDDAAIDALAAAVARGVGVRLLLSKGFNDRNERLPGQGGDNDAGIARLRRAIAARGAVRGSLDVRWYAHVPGVALDERPDRAYSAHAKQAFFDDQVAFVGSANMDTQSWNQSREVNVLVDSAEVVTRWRAQSFDPAFERSVPVP